MSNNINAEAPKTDEKPYLFQKGHKGGPGRPKGGGSTRGERLLQRIANATAPSLELIMTAIAEQAAQGDVQSAKIVLDRIAPVPKGRPLKNLRLPVGMGADAIAESFNEVLRGVNAGEITPSEAVELGTLLRMQLEALETRDVIKRLETLEKEADNAV
jgi:hypothetical protein